MFAPSQFVVTDFAELESKITLKTMQAWLLTPSSNNVRSIKELGSVSISSRVLDVLQCPRHNFQLYCACADRLRPADAYMLAPPMHIMLGSRTRTVYSRGEVYTITSQLFLRPLLALHTYRSRPRNKKISSWMCV